MKKILLLLLSVALFTTSFGSQNIEIKPTINANQIFLPVGNTGKKITLMELSQISLKDFEALTNRKMKFFDRLAFKSGQKKLRKGIEADGTIKKKKLQAFTKQFYGGETGFHFGGFALGFFVGLIGVLIAYLIKDDYKKNRVKWSWIGFGIGLVLNIILIIAVLDSVD